MIGDSLQDTFGVISISSNLSLIVNLIEMTTDIMVEAVYSSSVKPQTLTEYLPEAEITKNANDVNWNYNYLGGNEPIYLLAGSKIIYNTKVKRTGQVHVVENSMLHPLVCISLFNNPFNFANFILYRRYSGFTKGKCFYNFTENTTAVSWSFDIAEESQYYVGIYITKGVMVTSNVSINRVYYDPSEIELTEPVCNDTQFCLLQGCIFCDESYIIIQTNSSTNVSYTYSTSSSMLAIIPTTIGSLIVIFLCICACLVTRCHFIKTDIYTTPLAQASPSLSETTATIPSLSETTATIPSLSETTATIPSLSETTATIPSLSESIAMIPPSSEKETSSSQKCDQELPSKSL